MLTEGRREEVHLLSFRGFKDLVWILGACAPSYLTSFNARVGTGNAIWDWLHLFAQFHIFQHIQSKYYFLTITWLAFTAFPELYGGRYEREAKYRQFSCLSLLIPEFLKRGCMPAVWIPCEFIEITILGPTRDTISFFEADVNSRVFLSFSEALFITAPDAQWESSLSFAPPLQSTRGPSSLIPLTIPSLSSPPLAEPLLLLRPPPLVASPWLSPPPLPLFPSVKTLPFLSLYAIGKLKIRTVSV